MLSNVIFISVSVFKLDKKCQFSKQKKKFKSSSSAVNRPTAFRLLQTVMRHHKNNLQVEIPFVLFAATFIAFYDSLRRLPGSSRTVPGRPRPWWPPRPAWLGLALLGCRLSLHSAPLPPLWRSVWLRINYGGPLVAFSRSGTLR